jgi:hypothetical protein
MPSHWRKIAIFALLAVVALIAAAGAKHWFGSRDRRPALATVPPLPAVTRSSTIVAPVAIRLTAIRDALEKATPPELSGKADIPSLPIVSDVDIGWSVSRGPFAVTPRGGSLAISTSLSGSMRASGQLSNASGDLQDLLGNLFRGNAPSGSREQGSNTALDHGASIRGSATLLSRPALLPQWRLEPNLSWQVTIADASLSFQGVKLDVPDAVKPLIESTINEQVSSLQAYLRDDPPA